jgi:hypothetical protein
MDGVVHGWPGWSLFEVAPVLRDVLSLLLAALGAWLAWISFKMGRESVSSRADLQFQLTQLLMDEPGRRCVLYVTNAGRRTADGFYWHIYVPADIEFKYALPDAEEDENMLVLHGESKVYVGISGHVAKKLFAGHRAELGFLVVEHYERFEVLWAINAEDGRFPPDGYGRLDAECVNDL